MTMSETRKSYVLGMLEVQTQKDIDHLSRFIEQPRICSIFQSFEANVRREWERYCSTSLQSFDRSTSGVPLPVKNTPTVDHSTPTPVPETSSALSLEKPVPLLSTASPVRSTQVASNEGNTQDNEAISDVAANKAPKPISVTAPPPSSTDSRPAETVKSSPSVEAPRPVALPPLPGLTFKLRNGKQNETYTEPLAYEPDTTNIQILSVSLPAPLALAYDQATHLIRGIPPESGEFSVTVKYRCATDPIDSVRRDSFKLYINADPRSLWKDLPSDSSTPYWKPDVASEFVQGPQRQIVAARKRGRSHAHVGTCCDDDFVVHRIADGDWYVAVVADGAGSAKLSRYGSQIAVRAAGAFLQNALVGEGGRQVVEAAQQLESSDSTHPDARRTVLHHALFSTVGHAAHHAMLAINNAASSASIPSVKELSTTLLIGVARKIGERWLCAAYWIGDGAVGVYRAGKDIQLLGEVDSGEFSGQTRFLDVNAVSQEGLLKRTAFTIVDDFTSFVLMTDGVSDPKFETEARLAKLSEWDALWRELSTNVLNGQEGSAPEERLLEWLDFWSPGNHDDRTIAFIY